MKGAIQIGRRRKERKGKKLVDKVLIVTTTLLTPACPDISQRNFAVFIDGDVGDCEAR
jgi:hypothetical protein